MKIYIHDPNTGGRFSAESMDDVAAALADGTIHNKCMIWREGWAEWKSIGEIFPPNPPAAAAAASQAGQATKLVLKAASGLAGFANRQIKKATLKNRFAKALVAMLEDGKLTIEEVQALEQMVAESGGDWNEVIRECQPTARQFIRHLLADAVQDGDVSQSEEGEIKANLQRFGLQDMDKEVSGMIRRVRLCAMLRANKLPSPLKSAPPWLQSSEAVYFSAHAGLLKDGLAVGEGVLWVTSMRLEFVAKAKPVSLPFKHLRGAFQNRGCLHVSTSKAGGERCFLVDDAEVASELLLCLMRAANRTASVINGDDSRADRRKIPQDVRQAVWIRDAGQCAECGAMDYLEFDHIIPVAKGGGNTVANIQLLCRRCNGVKSDRI